MPQFLTLTTDGNAGPHLRVRVNDIRVYDESMDGKNTIIHFVEEAGVDPALVMESAHEIDVMIIQLGGAVARPWISGTVADKTAQLFPADILRNGTAKEDKGTQKEEPVMWTVP